MSRFTKAVERGLVGLLPETLSVETDESFFSWSSCDTCGSTLGGNRDTVTMQLADTGEAVELDVCSDCLMYLVNGDEPEDWEG